MENEAIKKSNLLELEFLRSELIEKTLNTNSNFLKISLYKNYFENVLYLNNPNFEEAFLKEFLDDYINCINRYEVFGVEPKISKNIFEQLKELSTRPVAVENLSTLNAEIERFEKQFEKLNTILKGKNSQYDETNKALFPLIDKEAPTGFYGIIESITIRINKFDQHEKFIIVPSEKEIEKKISEQCKKSWLAALGLSKGYIRTPFKHHEVIISFDKKEGIYEGNSLGIALTLSLIEQIIDFYNSAYIIKIKEQSAFTGGVTESGEVLCTSEEIIKKKVAAIFFSDVSTFVFPKCEETYAYFALTQLKKNYPERKLKLIPVEDINDVINRRDVVDIKKQKIVIRTGKFVKKNWISAAATVLLAIIFAFLFVMDFDDNPQLLTSDGTTLFIKNKNGKLLWTKKINVDKIEMQNNNYKNAKIADIDDDGQNELILCNENDNITGKIKKYGLTVCYDYTGKELWQYDFKDIVIANRENLNSEYGANILDTLTYLKQKSILCYANNEPSFSSAIYRLDIKTGKRLPGTFWASGHIMDGIIKDIDNDNKPDFVGVGYENGYEDFAFFVYEIDTLTKIRPTTEDYLIRDYPIAEMKSYIRFRKTDFDNLYKNRTPGYVINSLWSDDNNLKYIFSTSFPHDYRETEIGYEINYNLKMLIL